MDKLNNRFENISAEEVATLVTNILQQSFIVRTKANPRFSNDNGNTLRGFILTAIEVAELPPLAGIVALYYLHRITQLTPNPQIKLTTNNTPRMMLISLRVAEKQLIDSCLVTSDWSYVASIASKGSSLFSVRMINAMEVEFLNLLGWNIQVTQETLIEFVSSALLALDPSLGNIGENTKTLRDLKALSSGTLNPIPRNTSPIEPARAGSDPKCDSPTRTGGSLRDRLAARARGRGNARGGDGGSRGDDVVRAKSFQAIESMSPEPFVIPESAGVRATRSSYGYLQPLRKSRNFQQDARPAAGPATGEKKDVEPLSPSHPDAAKRPAVVSA